MRRAVDRRVASILAALSLVIVAAGTVQAHSFEDVDVEFWAGSGTNEALLVLDWKGVGAYLAFGYRWSGAATGLSMLQAVRSASGGRLYVEWVPGYPQQAVFGLGWDADDDGFSKTDPDDYYQEGWLETSYWSYWLSTNGQAWDYAEEGLVLRNLSDGDWDGWSWVSGSTALQPRVPLAPVPAWEGTPPVEAASLGTKTHLRSQHANVLFLLAIPAGMLFAWRARRRKPGVR